MLPEHTPDVLRETGSSAEEITAGARYDITNVLLTLAWLGEATLNQLHRICFPGCSLGTAKRVLMQLMKEGYVEQRTWGVSHGIGRHGKPLPRNRPPLRSLTRAGYALIENEAAYPTKPRKPRSALLLNHDSMTTEIVVRIIELGRSVGMSGLWIEHEVQLDPNRSRPVMDAFVVVRLGGAPVPPYQVPWTKDGRMEGERSGRLAIENDRATEGRREIQLKAESYQRAGTKAWMMQYGVFPIPTWVVPTPRRLSDILQWWSGAWPSGRWMMTTDEGLQRDQWIEYQGGRVAAKPLFRQASAAPLEWVPVGEWLGGR
ncbi:MAG TPA: replication-relaxation family protein [Roseiflexaceae bacterium]|nr:replication-relaxation family protein [Roseiflexaceae bacterium]